MASPAWGDRVGKARAERAVSWLSQGAWPRAKAVGSWTVPTCLSRVPTRTPFPSRSLSRMLPAATMGAVSRPLKWPPPRGSL